MQQRRTIPYRLVWGLWLALLLAGCGGPPPAAGLPPATSTPVLAGRPLATSTAPVSVTAPAPIVQPASSTQAPAPTAAAGSPTPSAENSSAPTVTLAEDGQTLTLRAGQRFLLKLGEDYQWTVTLDDQAVVSRVVNVMVVRGAQGLYEAHATGRATLTATGDPACRSAQPPCAAPSRLFRLQIIVQ